MATILKNIVRFTGLVDGVPVALPHRLNVNGQAVVPKTVEPNLGGFVITVDAVNLTVTRTVSGPAAVDVFVEFWHTIEAVVPLTPPFPELVGLVPWIQQPGTSSGAPGVIAVRFVNSDTAITIADQFLLVDTTASRIITLPDPTSGTQLYELKDISGLSETNPITLARFGGEMIEGIASDRLLQNNFGVWRVLSDGTNWWLV